MCSCSTQRLLSADYEWPESVPPVGSSRECPRNPDTKSISRVSSAQLQRICNLEDCLLAALRASDQRERSLPLRNRPLSEPERNEAMSCSVETAPIRHWTTYQIIWCVKVWYFAGSARRTIRDTHRQCKQILFTTRSSLKPEDTILRTNPSLFWSSYSSTVSLARTSTKPSVLSTGLSVLRPIVSNRVWALIFFALFRDVSSCPCLYTDP